MKRFILSGIGVLAVFLLSTSPASAQGTGGFQFGLSGGVSVPTASGSSSGGFLF